MEIKLSGNRSGVLRVVMALAGAALMMSPSYVGWYLLTRGKLSVSLVAVVALVMFLIGAFLIVNLLKE